jgi:hypothetical protein
MIEWGGAKMGGGRQGIHTEFWWETFLKADIYIIDKESLTVLFTLSNGIPK